MFMSSNPGRWFGLTSTTRGRVLYCEGDDIAAVDTPQECLQSKW
jgi:hypothetical protein